MANYCRAGIKSLRGTLLFDERNPAMIVGDAPLEEKEESAHEQHPEYGDTATDDGGGGTGSLESGHAERGHDASGKSAHQSASRSPGSGGPSQCPGGQGMNSLQPIVRPIVVDPA